MKCIALGPALAAALIASIAMSSPAMAQSTPSAEPADHYEWRNATACGPSAIARSVRVWIGPSTMAASCDYSMMTAGDAQAAAFMGMPKAGRPHADG